VYSPTGISDHIILILYLTDSYRPCEVHANHSLLSVGKHVEDYGLEQDLADCASTSASNQSLNAQTQNSILLREKNSSTNVWLENSV